MTTHAYSPLPTDVEDVAHRVIGCGIHVTCASAS